MIANLSLIAAVLALAGTSSAAATTTTAATTKATPAPLLTLKAFNGTFTGDYPEAFEVAPTNTTLAKQWIAQYNTANITSLPVVPFTSGGDPKDPNSISADACDWTITNCINKDITVCPLGVWGLTYDDGPTEFSSQLYDFLDTTEQKATLFYIGSNVITNWEAARRACGAGHQIASHTWSHQPSTSLTNEQFIAEIKYTEMAIKEVCGFTPKYFRPPYGDIDNRIRSLLWAMGYTSVIWDYDTNDWQMSPGGSRTLAEVNADFATWEAAAPNDTTGHITLEHELYQNTVTAAIDNLPKLGATWKLMPVSACMNDSHPYQETEYQLATMNGVVTGMTSATTSNTTTSSNTTSAAAAGASGTSTTGGKTSGAVAVTGEMKVFALIAAAAAAAAQMF
ncbi:chitin deacetylase [Mortierella sp. AD011]|nr:chitin deacetylase [Mortierella sp. AD010]KAF9403611.1 chitin deacetylase [Mortierella sp. AD011]